MKDFLDGLDLDKEIKFGIISAFISEHFNRRLFGEIMAIVDASSKDLESRRAIKSLVSQAFTRHTRDLLSSLDNLEDIKKEEKNNG